jgi:hypothetical protein
VCVCFSERLTKNFNTFLITVSKSQNTGLLSQYYIHMDVWKISICLPNIYVYIYIFISDEQFNYANVYFTHAVANTETVGLFYERIYFF